MTAPSPTVVEVVLAHRFARYPGICRCGGRWSGKHVAQALADAGVLGPEQAADLRAERDALRAKVERVEALAADPWIAHNRGDMARFQEGTSRRGAVRYGRFVAVDDLRAALRGES